VYEFGDEVWPLSVIYRDEVISRVESKHLVKGYSAIQSLKHGLADVFALESRAESL